MRLKERFIFINIKANLASAFKLRYYIITIFWNSHKEF